MRRLRLLRWRIAELFTRERRDRELSEEIQSHIELHIADNIRSGMAPDEARRIALVKFGSVEATKEDYRDRLSLPLLETIFHDVRYSVRTLRRQPVFTAVALLTLALGIGATTAIFSVVKAVILQPLPYRDPAALYLVHEVIPQLRERYPAVPVNAGHYTKWREKSQRLADMAAFDYQAVTITGSGEPERIGSARVTAGMFELLGVEPMIGRHFTPDDERQGRDDFVLLSHGYWQRRFAGDRSVTGKLIKVDGRNCTILGVMPPAFRFPTVNEVHPIRREIPRPDVIRPLIFSSQELRGQSGDFNYFVLARVAANTSRAQALAELNGIQAGIAELSGGQLSLEASLSPLQSYAVRDVKKGLTTMFCAVLALLLIVCANMANLLLAQGVTRRRELAIRAALGVTTARLLRQLMTEALLLALMGGALGIVVAFWSVDVVRRHVVLDLPRIEQVQVDPVVLLFALALSIVVGFLFGLLPARRLYQSDAGTALKANSRGSSTHKFGVRTKNILVAAESALCAGLLVVAGLLGSSFKRVLQVDKGFSAEHLVAAEIVLPEHRYKSAAIRNQLERDIVENASALPGVTSAAITSVLPYRGHDDISIVSRPSDHRPVVERPLAKYSYVSPEYLATLRVPLSQGRFFDKRDFGRRVAVISAETALRIWPGENPIGQQFRKLRNGPLIEVTGVVADVRSISLTEAPGLMIYEPYWASDAMQAAVLLRTDVPPESLAQPLQKMLKHLDPEIPVSTVRAMEEVVAESVASRQFQTALLIGFAAVAICLACIGVFGVVSHAVTQRNFEFGIRLALGARPGQIRSLVIRQGLIPVLAGSMLGLGAGLLAGRMLGSLLYDVSPADPTIAASVFLMLLAAGTAACFWPAYRATRVDPASTLRAD